MLATPQPTPHRPCGLNPASLSPRRRGEFSGALVACRAPVAAFERGSLARTQPSLVGRRPCPADVAPVCGPPPRRPRSRVSWSRAAGPRISDASPSFAGRGSLARLCVVCGRRRVRRFHAAGHRPPPFHRALACPTFPVGGPRSSKARPFAAGPQCFHAPLTPTPNPTYPPSPPKSSTDPLPVFADGVLPHSPGTHRPPRRLGTWSVRDRR